MLWKTINCLWSLQNTQLVPCVSLLWSSAPWPAEVGHLKQSKSTPLELLLLEQHLHGSACKRNKAKDVVVVWQGEKWPITKALLCHFLINTHFFMIWISLLQRSLFLEFSSRRQSFTAILSPDSCSKHRSEVKLNQRHSLEIMFS